MGKIKKKNRKKMVIILSVALVIIACLIGLIVTGKKIGWGPFAFLKYNNEEVYQFAGQTTGYTIVPFEVKTEQGTIRGRSYLPKTEGAKDALIFAHGYATDMKSVDGYCRVIANTGIACYAFDFRGGANTSTSDGSTVNMSPLTEAYDLNQVIKYVKSLPEVNTERVSLIGFSMGGLVSTLVASERDDIYHLILEYPAYIAVRNAKERYTDLSQVPDKDDFNSNGTSVGKKYYEDVFTIDVEKAVNKIDIKTLIMHGTADTAVPYEDSVEAVEWFKDAELILLEGQGHGFVGDGESKSLVYIYKFIKDLTAPDEICKKRAEYGVNDAKRDKGLLVPKNLICTNDIVYGEDELQTLDVYVQEGHGEKMPVIINCHGGGYYYGTKENYKYYCMNLAEHGFAVLNISYRLAPENSYPTQLYDIDQAVQYIMENTEFSYIDFENAFLVGDLAGAQLASQYAAILTNSQYADLFDHVFSDINVKAVAVNCGLYDMKSLIENKADSCYDTYIDDKSLDYSDTFDVLDYITADYPPCFVATSKGDFLKKYASPFADYLREKGIETECKVYGRMSTGHVFQLDIQNKYAIMCTNDEIEFFRKS